MKGMLVTLVRRALGRGGRTYHRGYHAGPSRRGRLGTIQRIARRVLR